MNGYSLLDLILKDVLFTINPLREDWSTRFHVINQIQDVVQSIESLRGATVEPFGSFVSNLFTRWGDLDISIEVQNGSYITPAGKKRKQSLLVEVMTALRKRVQLVDSSNFTGGCRRMQFIANAKVPILKFESSYNISCDISVNNLNGQMKSKILFWINEIDGRFRDLVLLIKEWAKAHNINDPKSGSLNSYSLSLLVIFHLQTCVPAIIPPLKEIYPGNMADDIIGVRADAEEHIKQTCELHINMFRSNKSRRINRSSLSELFISFLAKFSDIGLRASSQGISPYTAQWEDIDKNMRWLPKTCALFIEDPFEQPVNTARTLSSKQLNKVSQAIQTSHQLLASHNQDQSCFVSTLVRPHVAKLLPRAPIRNQNYYGRGSVGVRARPQVQHTVHSPKPQQFQNRRNDGHQAGTSYRPPVQSSNGQAQQTWRPKFDR